MNVELERLLKDFKSSKFNSKPNYIKIPVTELPINVDSMNLMNQLVSILRNDKHYHEAKRTASGGIAIHDIFNMFPSYSYTFDENKCELLILDSKMYRIQFGTHCNTTHISGRHAFVAFKGYCKKNSIDLSKYEVSEQEGKRIKTEDIPNPSILLAPGNKIEIDEKAIVDKEIKGVHHLDLNSAYPAGIVQEFPEFKEMLTGIYMKRNSKRKVIRKMYISDTEHIEKEITLGEWNKALMNLSIGFCQSKFCEYKYAKLSRAALVYTRTKVDTMVDILEDLGRIPLATNTDGIWYLGKQITNEDLSKYPGHHISNQLGDWKHDHRNCVVRFKSVGAYEFYEDCIFNEKKEVQSYGKYHAVVRGYTTLDRIKPRDKWKWGDIYQNDCLVELFHIDANGTIYHETASLN